MNTLNTILLCLSIVSGTIALGAWYAGRTPVTPPLREVRNVEADKLDEDEGKDFDRPTNPATCRARGVTPAQITVKQRGRAEASDPGFAPEVPDEPVEDEPEPVEEEPVVPAASGVETPPAPTPRAPVEDFRRGKFVIQGPPTQRAALYGILADSYPVYDDSWEHSGMTGFLPRITDEPLDVQQARHDAAALLDEVTA